MKFKIFLAFFCALGLFTLLECFSPKIIVYADAEYQDGDYFQFTPQQIYQQASTVISPGDHWYLFRYISNNWYHFQLVGVSSDILTAPESIDTSENARITLLPNYSTAVDYTYNLVTGELQRVAYYDWQNVSLYYLPNSYTAYYSDSVSITWANGSLNPTQSYDASYYIGASGFNIQFGAFANGNSNYHGWWVDTIDYKVTIQFTYNNQPLVVTVPSYKYYVMDIVRTFTASTPAYIKENPYYNIDTRYHMIKYKQSYHGYLDDEHTVYITGLDTPIIPYEDTWFNPEEDLQTVSLFDVYMSLLDDYPNMQLSDLKQDITVSFIGASDNHTYYSNILRYSQVTFPAEVPPRDDSAPDWFKSVQELVNQMQVNQTYNYLSELPPGYTPVRNVGSLGELNTISRPDFEYHEFEPDEDALGFFTWLVNLLFASPLGLCFTLCLGFLVVKAVLHND